MTHDLTALESLLGADGARELRSARWPLRPYVVHRELAELPAPLRSPLLLEPRNLTRVYRGPVEITNGRSGQYRVSGPDPSVYFDALGLAARFTELEAYLPDAVPWLRALERDLGVPDGAASLHSFINAEGVGLATHCDPGEHIAIQLAGTKTFRYQQSPLARTTSMSHAPECEPTRNALAQCPDGLPTWLPLPADAETVTLRPGSVLFLPRGCYHETVAGAGGRSVTLVIQLQVPTYLQLVVQYLADFLSQSERWRQPVCGAWSDDDPARPASTARLGELLGELGAQLGGLSTEHILRAQARGPGALTFAWGAQLQRNPVATIELQDDDTSVTVTVQSAAGPAHASLQAEARPIFEWLTARAARFDLAALSAAFDDWDEASLTAIVRFLVNSRFLLVLPIEPYPGRPEAVAAEAARRAA